jgi:hypothetical protein
VYTKCIFFASSAGLSASTAEVPSSTDPVLR